MADLDHNLSLADALTEPPAEIEEEVKRDFIATLEAEKFDDVVGETVGKTDYIPLLDDDDDDAKAASQEPKSKPHTDGGQVESTSAVGPAVLENGDHGIEDDSTVSPREIMGEKMSYKEFLDRNETWAMDDRVLCFESQSIFRPMEGTEPFKMHREDVLSDLLLHPSEMETRLPFTEHFQASEEVYAPHAAMMVPQLPSLRSPYSPAEVIDPSAFITLDSTAESLLNIGAPARVTVPEEHWLGAQHAVEELDESSFVEPPEPTRITDAAEQYLPGSPVAAAPAAVPSALIEPIGETKATDTPQVEPTGKIWVCIGDGLFGDRFKIMKKLWREVCASNNFTRPIIMVETQTILKMMKHRKAVGLDDASIEAFKVSGHAGVVVMIFFSVILCTGKMPDEWRKSTLDMYEDSTTIVITSCGYSESFTVRVDLYKGSALGPFLFVIVMNSVTYSLSGGPYVDST
ncbi:titin -like protein, partial [Chelydra serpentina]